MNRDPDLYRLVREARDQDAALAELQGCVQRLRRARAAQTAPARLPADQLRAGLQSLRAELGGGRL